MKSVPELKIWQSNLVGLATYYRASGLRTKELKSAKPSMKVFPAHHVWGAVTAKIQPLLFFKMVPCIL